MDADYFKDLYAAKGDPWNFAGSPYETAKYTATLRALPQTRFTRALEVGCSIGVFTARLAPRCDELIAIDPVPQAIDEAKQRCAGLPAEFAVMWAPQDWPAGSFDLITLSEVLYYLTIEPLDVLADRVAASLRPGGYAILVHWIKETDYPLTGDQAAERFLARSRSWAKIIRQQRTADYRLDLVQRI